MKSVRVIALILAFIMLLSACSLVYVVEDMFFPKPEKPAQILEEELTRAPNTDTFTVIDELGREWRQKGGKILLNGDPVKRLTSTADSPLSYIEGCLYYMAPEGFTRYNIEDGKIAPLYYDVMDMAVAGLNRVYYIRDNMLISFCASDTDINVSLIGYLTGAYDVDVVDNLLSIQGYSIDLLTDTVQK